MSHHPPMPMFDPSAESPAGTPGIAVASVVVSGVGVCVPGAGVVGVVLGFIGIVQSRSRGTGIGASVAGIVLGVVTSALWLAIFFALLMPAFGSGLGFARVGVAGFHMQAIAAAMNQHAAANGDVHPPPGTNFETLLGAEVPAAMWSSPFSAAPADRPSFLLVYESTDPPYAPRWIMLNPDFDDAPRIPIIEIDSSTMEVVERGEAVRRIGDSALYTTDGRPWRLTGPVPP